MQTSFSLLQGLPEPKEKIRRLPDLIKSSQETRYSKTIHESHYTLQMDADAAKPDPKGRDDDFTVPPGYSGYRGTNYSLICDVLFFCPNTSDDLSSYHIFANAVKAAPQVFPLSSDFV